MSIEEKLKEWAAQAPGLRVSPAENQFIADMRRARAQGVGFGWMQQVIEWEWQSIGGPGAWGPESFSTERREFEAAIDKTREQLECASRLAHTVRAHLSLVDDWLRCPDPLPIEELRKSRPYLERAVRGFEIRTGAKP